MSTTDSGSSVAPASWMEWASAELGDAGLGDKRLDKRLVKIVAAFLAAPEASIPKACGGWPGAKAAYRFFDNETVTPEAIIERHRKSLVERARGEKVVLAISDTTMLDYTSHPQTEGLGPLGDLIHQGFVVHPVLVVTPKDVPLGIANLDVWVRDIYEFGEANQEERRKKSIEEKESQKWLTAFEASERLQAELGEETTVVAVSDRESDVFEVFARATAPGTKSLVLVRASSDRALVDEEDEGHGYLWEELQAAPVIGTAVILKPRNPESPKPRKATLSIRFKQVTLRVPKNRLKSSGLKPVTVTAIFAHEDEPPMGQEPISWMLLTTVPTRTAEEAFERVSWYASRWQIEVFFKVLKSGCQAEERQLETADRLRRCMALDVVVAWRIQYLTMVGRATPDLPCSVVFEEYEWKALYVFVNKSPDAIPQEVPTLREVTRLIGRLGGHLGRKSDGEPGTLTLWRGLQRLPDIAEMWQIYEDM